MKSTGTVSTTPKHDSNGANHDNALGKLPSKQPCQVEVGVNLNTDCDPSGLQGAECEVDTTMLIERKIKEAKKLREKLQSGEGNKTKVQHEEISNPDTVDVRAVVQMLQNLKMEIQKNQDEVARKPNATMEELQRRIAACEQKEKVMIETMSHMSDVINELQKKNEILESNNAKRMVILAGFYGSKKKYEFRRQLEHFFVTNMDIEVSFEDFFFIGQNEPREVVLILTSINECREIFRNAKKLENVANKHGGRFSIRNYMTPQAVEFNKKLRSVKDDMENVDSVDQEEIAVIKGHIHIGDSVYERQVSPPDPTKVLQMSLEEIDRIMSVKVQKSKEIVVKGNTFTAYSICTDQQSVVQDAYCRVRMSHAGARHIVAAWRVPGLRPSECNNYCDDEDYGCGAAVAGWMKDNNISHRAIFVVRKCGRKLNQERFATYISACRAVLQEYPNNEVINVNQFMEVEKVEAEHTYAGAVKQPARPRKKTQNTRGPKYPTKKKKPARELRVYIPPTTEKQETDEKQMEWDVQSNGSVE